MASIKLTIHTPGDNKAKEIKFLTLTANSPYHIPYRFDLDAIENKDDLKASGKLRHKGEESAINGGIQLPRTEKLILLVKGNSATAKLNIGGMEHELASGSKLFEVDLYDFGTKLNNKGEVEIKCDKQIDVALIARF